MTKRIFIIGPAFYARGGVEVIAEKQLEGFAKSGYETFIVITEEAYIKLGSWYRRDDIKSRFLVVPKKHKGTLSYLIFLTNSLVKKGDIVISYNQAISCYLAILSRIRRFNIVAYQHFDFDNISYGWRIARHFLYRILDTVVVLNEFDVKRYSGICKNVIPIPNYFHVDVRRQSDFTLRDNKAIYLGHITERKNVHTLIQAVNLIKTELREINFSLSIYGTGDDQHRCNEFINSSQIEDLVILHGYNDDINEIYDEASFLVLPSSTECQPIVVIDALKKGVIPLVSEYSDAVYELIENEVNGFIIDEISPRGIANMLLLLSKLTLVERKKLSLNAVKHSNKYSYESNINKWLTVVKNI
ncbi:glycosyltransferase [Vibrio coralliirubri]|uniref:glycosyltransferase n=1 Tax=Vibrio coralliirubri TaxID=1516159 RepID=UPI000633E629|nr:glycosyltransferase [Vibrio coralliirubri]CDU01229.1 hypothetical protein VCR8J2_820038 [Vibrio coralliirubri]